MPPTRDAAADTVERYPLTPTQQGMLLGSMRGGQGLELHQVVVQMGRDVDARRLHDAWEYAVQRHAILRAQFRWQDEPVPMQEVLAHVDLPLVVRTGTNLDEFLDEDRAQGISLERAPAFRLTLLELPGEATLVFTHHHVMLDGRSQRILLEDVMRWYDSAVDPAVADPPRFGLHCEAVARRDTSGERAHFERLLEGVDVNVLPETAAGGDKPAGRGEVMLTMPLEADASSPDPTAPTLASYVQAAWAVVLGAYARSSDVVFGVTRSGRFMVDGAQGMVGCLINTVPARVQLDASASAHALASGVHAASRAVRPFEQASLSEIQGWLALDRPVFDTIVVFERFSLDDALKRVSPEATHRAHRVVQQSSFPVVLAAYQRPDSLECFLEFDAQRWDETGMSALLARFAAVLRQMRSDPSRLLGQLELTLPGEREKLLAWSKGPLTDRLDGRVLAQVLAQREDDDADRPAFVEASGQLRTHRDLRARRDDAIGHLQSQLGARPACIAVATKRSVGYLALQLAAFTRGDVFVPLDPDWPLQRLVDVIRVARPKALYVEGDEMARAMARPASTGADDWPVVVRIGDIVRAGVDQRPDTALEATVPASEAPAYAIFTSGSTGTPKGVLVTHAALMAHAAAAVACYGLSSSDRVLQFASPAFDVALEESIPILTVGGCLIEREDAFATDIDLFLRGVAERAVTVLNLPSGFFHLLMLHLHERDMRLPGSVRLVVFGSERPTTWSVQTLHSLHPHVRMVNAYGPTEATITSNACDVTALLSRRGLYGDVPIGGPWGACQTYLLDAHERLCPPGVPGEICITGPQVAHGYLHGPEAGATRFGASPIDGQRMYRTGDVGRWRDDGLMEFIGRADEQVKIRGVRVEPGEVEQALRSFEGVSDAAVIVRPSARGHELVAFVMTHAGADVSETLLRDGLSAKLPGSFVPSEVRVVSAFPRLSNGKLDRKAMATLAKVMPVDQRDVAEASGDLETFILGTFSRLLGRDDLGVNDSFFDSGGHSLLAIQLLGAINRIVNPPISLGTIFAAPTVRALAAHIDQPQRVHLPSVVPLNGRALALMAPRARGVDNEWPEDRIRVAEPLPMFLVCGVNLYAQLARSMNADRAVFGVFVENEERVAAGQWMQLDASRMAAGYIDVLKSQWPNGPYILGGVSFGGLLAYEMAQQLRRSGDKVRLLVLLDTILPRAIRVHGALARFRRKLRIWVENATGLNPREFAFDSLSRVMTRLGQRNAGRVVVEARVARDRMYRMAADKYDRIVQPYSGEALLVRARRSLEDEREKIDWDHGWAGLLPHETPFFGVDGDHLGILVQPGADAIARIVQQKLSEH